MIRPPIFRGKVENDTIILDNRIKFRELRKSLEGKRIEIILRERTAQRSSQANKYYHKVVVDRLARHIGYEHKEMHKVLKEHFNIKSTSKLEKKEFQEYIEACRRFAAIEHGLDIPDPEEVEY